MSTFCVVYSPTNPELVSKNDTYSWEHFLCHFSKRSELRLTVCNYNTSPSFKVTVTFYVFTSGALQKGFRDLWEYSSPSCAVSLQGINSRGIQAENREREAVLLTLEQLYTRKSENTTTDGKLGFVLSCLNRMFSVQLVLLLSRDSYCSIRFPQPFLPPKIVRSHRHAFHKLDISSPSHIYANNVLWNLPKDFLRAEG